MIILMILFVLIAMVDVLAIVSNRKTRCIDCAYFLNCNDADKDKCKCERYIKRCQNKNTEKWQEN